MAVYRLEGRTPFIGEGSFVCPDATVIGDVRIGRRCFIAPGARLRGDYGTIIIGDGTAIEDNCVVHARPGEVCRIGSHVTVGHSAVIHNAEVGDWVVVGMGAVVSDYAVVGEWAVIGEGAVVKRGQEIPAGHVAVGVPAVVKGQTSEEYREQWTKFKGIYEGLASSKYPEELERCE